MREIIRDPEVRKQMGEKLFAELDAKIKRMELAFTKGGDYHAEQLGKDIGELVWQVGTVASGAVGAVKGGALLAKAGIKVTMKGAVKLSRGAVVDAGIQWGKGVNAQGLPWESYLAKQLPEGSSLPKNFKTFDFYDGATKTAISAKTLDTTTAARIAKPSQVYDSLKGYIDKIANFEEHTLKETTISRDIIKSHELHVAVHEKTTFAQWDQIDKAIQYGQSRGVNVKVTRSK